ncbi:MAG TPA: tetratricopeptide repeat protein, partial [Terriglobia bacterium]
MQQSAHRINELMDEVRRLLESGQFEAALQLSERCLELSSNMPDPAVRARALVTKGITLARTDDHLNALKLYDTAIQLYESANDELAAAKVRMNRVHSYCHLSRYEDALRDGEAGNRIFARFGEKQLLARGLNNLGEVFFRLDRFQERLDTLERAAALLCEIGDDRSLAMVYMNHAVVLTSLNRGDEARVYYQLSKDKAEESGQTWLAACGNYNLGYLHYMQGEYTRALDILNETRTALAADPWYGPLCDLTQSEIYLEMNMYAEAMAAAEAAYKGFEDNHKPFEMAKAVAVMAIAQSEREQFQEAARLFDRARTMFKAQGNDVRAAGMDLYQGVMWLHQGRHVDARTLALSAYEAFAKEDVKPNAAFARIVSARAALEAGDLNTASLDVDIAAALHRESSRALVGHQLHALSGEIHRARGNLADAAAEFRLAIQELEAVRANIAADELRLNYFKDKVPVYERLMRTDLQTGDPASLREAFETAERAKSRTLVDLLAGSVESLKQARSASLEEIQQALAPDTILIEYVMTGGTVAAFCVSRAGFAVFQDICSAGELKQRFGFIQFHFSRLAAQQ